MPDNKHAHIYSRDAVLDSYGGSSTYVLWLAGQLRDAGWTVSFFVLRGLWPNRRPWFRVRLAAEAFDAIVVPGHIRIGRYFVQLNFLTPWLIGVYTAAASLFMRLVRCLSEACRPARGFFARKRASALRRSPWNLAPATAREAGYAAGQIRTAGPALVIASYAYLAPIFEKRTQGEFTSLILMHDLLSRHVDLLRSHGQPAPAPISFQDELSWLRMADCVVAIQPAEAAVVREAVKPSAVVVVPQGVRPVEPGSATQPGRCLFVASAAAPNADALEYMVNEVWPEVRTRVPWAELRVAGTVAARHRDCGRGIDYAGPVEDLEAEYRAAQVVVVPVRFGTGLKIKAIEALAHGCPCVSTPAGVEGLAPEALAAVLIARSATGFVDGVVRLLTNEQERSSLSASALSAVRTCYTSEKCMEALLEFLRNAGAQGRGHAGPRACPEVPSVCE